MTHGHREEVMKRARQKLVDSQLWGSAVQAGIMSGSFDNGSLILTHVAEAEKEIIAEQKEVEDVE